MGTIEEKSSVKIGNNVVKTEDSEDVLKRCYYYSTLQENGKTKLDMLVDKIVKPFGFSDNTEFYSIANETLLKCARTYDASKGATFDTFLQGCLQRKCRSQLSFTNRKKRMVTDEYGNRIHEERLDRVIDDSGEVTVGDMIESNNNFVESLLEKYGSVNDFLDILPNDERELAKLFLDGYKHKEAKEILGLSDSEFNRLLTSMKKYEKISILRKNTDHKKSNRNRENEVIEMERIKASNNGDKSKSEGVTVETLIKKLEGEDYLINHPLQRESDQWSPEYKGNLITTVMNGFRFNPLILCQEFKNGMEFDWIIDGVQRSTTLHSYYINKFKVSKKAMNTKITYIHKVVDENGNFEHGEDGMILKETVEYDIAGKYFKDLPTELQDIFLGYLVPIEKYLDCTVEEIKYHITRYNDAKPMSPSNKGILRLGEETANTVKMITKNSPFFKDRSNLGIKKASNEVIHRIVVESVMASYYLDNWNKTYDMTCRFLADHATTSDFDEFSSLLVALSNIVDEETGMIFTASESFLWIALFDKFYNYIMENNDDVSIDQFHDFMKEFLNGLHEKRINGISYDMLKEKGTKDTNVVKGKLNHLTTLLYNFLGIDPENNPTDDDSDRDSNETSNDNESTVIEGEIVNENEEIRDQIEEEINNFDENTVNVDTIGESSYEIEDPDQLEKETVEAEAGPKVDPLFYDFIDMFKESFTVKKFEGDEADFNIAAIRTLMVQRGIPDLDVDSVNNFVDSGDIDRELVDETKNFMDLLDSWTTFVNVNSSLLSLENMPVLIAIASYSIQNEFDPKVCRSWFETFAFTYKSELDEIEPYQLLRKMIDDLKKAIERSKKTASRPVLVF